jgi:HAE1 family hydrophobic/amphiphilic exporter-1
LPLVLAPGAGSELYRGIGAVLLGGLLVSTVVTLVFVPALLSLMMQLQEYLFGAVRPRIGERDVELTDDVAPPRPAQPREPAPTPAGV